MKNILMVLLLLSSINLTLAQKIEIDQETANKCFKCFDEIEAWKEAVRKLEISSIKDQESIKQLNLLIGFYDKYSKSQDSEILELRKSIRELMEYVIKRPTKKCVGIVISC